MWCEDYRECRFGRDQERSGPFRHYGGRFEENRIDISQAFLFLICHSNHVSHNKSERNCEESPSTLLTVFEEG
jgi:hypothetical protein